VIIYRVIRDYGDIKVGTSLIFNKSQQRFENFSHTKFISNVESAHHPGLIVVLRELTAVSERKKTFFTIPF